MLLSIIDRLSIKGLYPKEKLNLLLNAVMDEIDKKVNPTSEELSCLQINPDNTITQESIKKVADKEIEFSDITLNQLKQWVSQRDAANDIPREISSVCRKISEFKKI